MFSLWQYEQTTSNQIKASPQFVFEQAAQWLEVNARDDDPQIYPDELVIELHGGSIWCSLFGLGSEHSCKHSIQYTFDETELGCLVTCAIRFKLFGFVFGGNSLYKERDKLIEELRYLCGSDHDDRDLSPSSSGPKSSSEQVIRKEDFREPL